MTPLDTAYRTVMDERISELLRYRRWYRARPDWFAFSILAAKNDIELRALVTLARQARKAEAAVWDRLSDADLDDDDRDDRGNHYLFPEGVIEGLPEFNGSFK